MSLPVLAVLAMNYINFMSNVGDANSEIDYVTELPAHFSENITKIENGKVIVQGHEKLAEQLKNARKYGAPWSLKVLDVLSDEQNHSAVVRFTWNSKKVGLHITTAILKFDEDNKIQEIAEVYNKHGDVTHYTEDR